MKIPRYIKKPILEKISQKQNKAIIIYGPRQSGKTTLLNDLKNEIDGGIRMESGENRDVHEWLGSQSLTKLKSFIGSAKTLIIDEAQKISQIGLNIKIIVDSLPDVRVIATGSSSFELSSQIGEPLVGRKWQFFLFPAAQLELARIEHISETKQLLSERMIYGGYPETIISPDAAKKREVLDSILDNYLFKDILALEDIRKSGKLIDLLKLIAFQIGHEVSLRELGNNLGLNIATVERYLDLLEKSFVIKRVGGFARNLRKEISKTSRYYFIDNGVRNAVIKNFNNLDTRDDVGELWENYLFAERMKKREYMKIYANEYFWRTYDKKEIDLVEERDGKLYGFEFKWSKGAKPPKDWLAAYKEAEFKTINQENYLEFIA